ncbi:hypothetical protein KAX02_10075 [candidate division WOR-3 bacterium]|nr:hypothetical protein [candidate division WOR-3 bacterium]
MKVVTVEVTDLDILPYLESKETRVGATVFRLLYVRIIKITGRSNLLVAILLT